MRTSHPSKEGMLQASKWLSHRVLLDGEEMEELFRALPPFRIFNVSQLVPIGGGEISSETFLTHYHTYVDALKKGETPSPSPPIFSAALSAGESPFYFMPVKEGRGIIKIKTPVIQCSLHHFAYSAEEGTFHSMVHSTEAISWGLQFSFPQLYSNSLHPEVIEIYKDPNDPNALIFKAITKKVRALSAPTPFMMGDRRINATFRIGKKAREWIHHHPQLKTGALTHVH